MTIAPGPTDNPGEISDESDSDVDHFQGVRANWENRSSSPPITATSTNNEYRSFQRHGYNESEGQRETQSTGTELAISHEPVSLAISEEPFTTSFCDDRKEEETSALFTLSLDDQLERVTTLPKKEDTGFETMLSTDFDGTALRASFDETATNSYFDHTNQYGTQTHDTSSVPEIVGGLMTSSAVEEHTASFEVSAVFDTDVSNVLSQLPTCFSLDNADNASAGQYTGGYYAADEFQTDSLLSVSEHSHQDPKLSSAEGVSLPSAKRVPVYGPDASQLRGPNLSIRCAQSKLARYISLSWCENKSMRCFLCVFINIVDILYSLLKFSVFSPRAIVLFIYLFYYFFLFLWFR